MGVFGITLLFQLKIRNAVSFFRRNFPNYFISFFGNQKEPAAPDLQKFRFFYLKIS